MRKYITPSCDCGLELDLVVEYEYSPFVAGRLTGPPEHCYPDEHESLVIESVYLIGDGEQNRADITDCLSEEQIIQLESQVMDHIQAEQEQADADEYEARQERMRDMPDPEDFR